METIIHFWSYLSQFFLVWEKIQAEVVEKTNTHFILNNFLLRKSCCLWDNVENIVEPGRPQMTWRMDILCYIPKATDTHSECVTHCFSTALVVVRTRINVAAYVHCVSCSYWFICHRRCVILVNHSVFKSNLPLQRAQSLWRYSIHWTRNFPTFYRNKLFKKPDSVLKTSVAGPSS
jgi:hypothetical protein